MTLSPSFGHFISAWEFVPSDKQTKSLNTRMLIEEKWADSQNQSSGSAALKGQNGKIDVKSVEMKYLKCLGQTVWLNFWIHCSWKDCTLVSRAEG